MLVASNSENTNHYGAFNFGSNDGVLTVDVIALVTDELPPPTSLLPIYAWDAYITWALTIFVTSFDPAAIKAYSVPNGRFQFGEVSYQATNARTEYAFQTYETQLYPYKQSWSYRSGIPNFTPDYEPSLISSDAEIMPLSRYAGGGYGASNYSIATSFTFNPMPSVEYVAQVGYYTGTANTLIAPVDYILWLNV